MEFTYTIKKEDLKKYLKKRHRGVNITCICFFIILFMLINLKTFQNNKLLISFFLLLFVLGVSLFIFLTNQIFIHCLIRKMEHDQKTFGRHQVVIDKNHIEDTIHKNKLAYAWKDVRDVKIDDEMIVIKPKEGTVSLVFHKCILKEQKFKEIQKEIRKNYKK